MKRCCKVGTLALYEVRTQWKSFIFFLLISSILLSAMISIFTLAKRVPAEITEYIQSTGEGSIVIRKMPVDKLSLVEEMPVKLMDCHISYLEPTAIGLAPDWDPQEETEDGQVIQLSFLGGLLRWMPEGKSFHAAELEQQLICGRGIAQQDNTGAAIWLSADAAEQLGADWGDTVSFCADSAVARRVSCRVAGIYQQNVYLYTYYVSLPLYMQSLEEADTLEVTLAPLNLKDYGNILSELQENRIFPDDAREFMDNVMLLIYALYAVCVFLCILEASMVFSISRSYFHKRNVFFAVCKAIGMQNRSILLVVCIVMQALLCIAFLAAMLLAPHLNQYVVDLLDELFTGVKISVNVWNPFSFLIFLLTSALLWLTCLCTQAVYTAPDIVELIRREDQ
ncbi:hypothetical protein [Ruminococcus sp.]|uniref:hypothetical protein n=1 Tax=Ruminococcus sp. TaxID=41978 RepID=UPI003F04FDBB